MKNKRLFTEKRKNFPHTSGIYLIYSPINDGYYIGSSIDLQSRLCGHRNNLKRNSHDNLKLQNAYNKYGHKAFMYKILYQYDHFIIYNSDEYINDLLVKEKYYIELYKSHYLYNIVMDPTTQLPEIPKIAVYQYDKDGNFIREWESAEEVHRMLGVQLRTALLTHIKAAGYFWRKEKVDKLDLSYLKNRGSGIKSKQEVSLYNLLGKKILTFSSITELSNYLKVSVNLINTSIKTTGAITGTYYRAGKGHDDWLDNDINFHRRFHFVIAQFDLNGNFIKLFPGIEEAQKELHLTSIYDNISGKTKKSGNFVFKKLSNELVKFCELPEVP